MSEDEDFPDELWDMLESVERQKVRGNGRVIAFLLASTCFCWPSQQLMLSSMFMPCTGS